MQWNESYSESVYTFANTINTIEGGTHEEGFRAALTSVVNKWADRQEDLQGEDDKLTGDDIREGLAAIVSIKLGEPQFEGQTKTKLGNSEAKSFVQKCLQRLAGRLVRAQPGRGQGDRHQGLAGGPGAQGGAAGPQAGAQERAGHDGNARQAARLPLDRSGRERALHRRGRLRRRLGQVSAETRCSRRSCPIRGKIINVEKARIDRVLKNNEVQSLITALGTGIHDDFDLSKLRYHKIVLMADADVDGQHITTLLLTLLFRFMRPLIEAGHVYLAAPPLYKIKWSKGEPGYAYSDKERDGLVKAGLEAGRKLPKEDAIARYKGLGEMNSKELWETTMDPANRILRLVTLDDAATADELFSVLMGEDVEARRSFIIRNAKDVRFLDI